MLLFVSLAERGVPRNSGHLHYFSLAQCRTEVKLVWRPGNIIWLSSLIYDSAPIIYGFLNHRNTQFNKLFWFAQEREKKRAGMRAMSVRLHEQQGVHFRNA